MANQLKPCPFCGGPAEERVTGPIYNKQYEVVCTRCGCKTGKTVCSPLHIRKWNGRCDAKPDGCWTCAWFRRDETSTRTWCQLVHQERKRDDYCSRWVEEGTL